MQSYDKGLRYGERSLRKAGKESRSETESRRKSFEKRGGKTRLPAVRRGAKRVKRKSFGTFLGNSGSNGEE